MRTQAQDGSKMRLRKMWHTEFPSIQGPWTPFTFINPIVNITKFPDVSSGFLFQEFYFAIIIVIYILSSDKLVKSNMY